MPKTASIFQDIKNRFIAANEKYKSIENLCRRRVGAIAGMDLERELAVERFCLKAIFGWKPLNNDYNIAVSRERLELDDGRIYKPIATEWFNDLNLVKYKLEAEDPELITGEMLELLGKNICQLEKKLRRLEDAVKALIKDCQRNETEREPAEVLERWNKACVAITCGVPIAEACRGETIMSWLRKRAQHNDTKSKEKEDGTSKEKSDPAKNTLEDLFSDDEEESNDEKEDVKEESTKQAADWEYAVKLGVCYEIAVAFEVPVWHCAPIPPFEWTMLGWGPRQKLIEMKEVYTNSFTITASAANTALFDEYIAAWKALTPHEATYPYPVPGMTKEAVRHFTRITLSRTSISRLWPNQKIKLMVKSFLMAGKGIAATFTEDHAKIEVKLARSTTDVQMNAFKKYLRHKELPRWHSDWINRRTGDANSIQPDESIGTREEVKLVRTAIDEMVEMCETWRRK